MLEKCRILYKGDMIAASFYVFTGMILLLFALILQYFTISIGYKYLSYGFFMFFLYCLGKGAVLFYSSRQRYEFYKAKAALTASLISEETAYTAFRIEKKQRNRRIYVYVVAISSIMAFVGIFTQQKGLIMGTAIPIALISGIELGIGLLTEFRLREYFRQLNKKHF
jgi:hypothetical protein